MAKPPGLQNVGHVGRVHGKVWDGNPATPAARTFQLSQTLCIQVGDLVHPSEIGDFF